MLMFFSMSLYPHAVSYCLFFGPAFVMQVGFVCVSNLISYCDCWYLAMYYVVFAFLMLEKAFYWTNVYLASRDAFPMPLAICVSEYIQPFSRSYISSKCLAYNFIMANADEINPSPKISRDLMCVAGVLQDMQDAGELQPMSLGVPPVAFVAGGPMWVIFSPLDLPRLLWLVRNMWFCSSRTLIGTPNVLGFTRLKRFDESTITSRRGSQAATPPIAVKGIGGKGVSKPLILLQPSIPNVDSCTCTVAKPDYSDNKIVLAMVCGFF